MSKFHPDSTIPEDEHDSEEGVKVMLHAFEGEMDEEFRLAGDPFEEDEGSEFAVGRTMFDTSNSKDNTVTVVIPKNKTGKIAAQSLVRVDSLPAERGGDGKRYIGAVVEGPFAEPDGLRGDSPI